MKHLRDWTNKPSANSVSEKAKENRIHTPEKADRILLSLTTLASFMTFGTGTALAAEDMFTKLQNEMFDLAGNISTTGIAVCAVCAGLALLITAFFPSEQGASTGKKWLTRILLVIFAFCALGFIFSFVMSLAEGYGIQNYKSQIFPGATGVS